MFMAMTCGEIPDHSTIAAFVSSMENEITPLFTQVLLICDEKGLLGGTHFSIDASNCLQMLRRNGRVNLII